MFHFFVYTKSRSGSKSSLFSPDWVESSDLARCNIASISPKDGIYSDRLGGDALGFYTAMMRLSESKENWFIFAKREHHHHFQWQRYKKSGTMQNLSWLFFYNRRDHRHVRQGQGWLQKEHTTSTFNEERQKNCRSSSENPKTITGWGWGG